MIAHRDAWQRILLLSSLSLSACQPAIAPSKTSTPEPRRIFPTTLVAPSPYATNTLLPTTIPTILERAPSATATVEARTEVNVLDILMAPIISEATKRRIERAKDPEVRERIDPALNNGRINFLLFGYGETHEPPALEKATIGSHTVVSYDTRNHRVDIISLTHDIRAPEVEAALRKLWKTDKVGPVKIDQAYFVGGRNLNRQVIENATGLWVDYQLAFPDSVIRDFVDQVMDGIEMDVPESFDVQPFYLDGTKYPGAHFEKGPQKITGLQAIQIIKTVPVATGNYDKSLEHNKRKDWVIEASVKKGKQRMGDRTFFLRAGAFLTGQLANNRLDNDVDLLSLVANLGSVANSVNPAATNSRTSFVLGVDFGKEAYVHDPESGVGGVQWVKANAVINHWTQRDIDRGLYPNGGDVGMAVPIDGNPSGDLVKEYWPSLRSRVREILQNR